MCFIGKYSLLPAENHHVTCNDPMLQASYLKDPQSQGHDKCVRSMNLRIMC